MGTSMTNIGIFWTLVILIPSTFAVIIGSVWALQFHQKPGYLVNTMGLVGFWVAALMPYLHGIEPSSPPEINVSTNGEFVSFERGEPVSASGGTVWTELPESLRGASFWQHKDFQQGRAVFQIEHGGTVYLAATCRWLKDDRGSATRTNCCAAAGSRSAMPKVVTWTGRYSAGTAKRASSSRFRRSYTQRQCRLS